MSGKSMIPIVYYPLKVLFVDDNLTLLQSFEKDFHNKYKLQTASSGEEALRILNSRLANKPSVFTEMIHDTQVNLSKEDEPISQIGVTLDGILAIANDVNKYDDIGIVVADYEMTGMNGITLCEKLAHTLLKKILLTGKLDVASAINALNDQLIDCYIEKGSEQTIADIDFYITQLHQRYFSQLSAVIAATPSAGKLAFLTDATFGSFFNSIIKQHNIKEYYLIDSNGSFLLVDDKGQRSVFLVHTDNSLDEFCEIFQHEAAVTALISRVGQRELIPFFGINVDPAEVAMSNWDRHFYPAQHHANFYWSIVAV